MKNNSEIIDFAFTEKSQHLAENIKEIDVNVTEFDCFGDENNYQTEYRMLLQDVLKRLDTLGRFFAISFKGVVGGGGGYFSYFLFAFLHTDPLLEKKMKKKKKKKYICKRNKMLKGDQILSY